MRKRFWLLALGTAMMAAGGRTWAANGPAEKRQTDAFAAELFGQLDQGAGKNLFFSPYSVRAALAMTAEGAGGPTKAQMYQVLHLSGAQSLQEEMAHLTDLSAGADADKSAFTLSIANALWVDQTFPLKPEYVASVKHDFRAEANTVDFVTAADAARGTINDWVAKATNDKIKDLLPAGSVDKSTALVLTNAVYFKAAWQFPFTESATNDQPFHLGGGKVVTVPMMQGPSATFLNYGETDDLQLVAMPYQMIPTGRPVIRGDTTPSSVEMVLLVPKKTDGLEGVKKEMSIENLGKWLGAMESTPVQVEMPRFKMETSLELADTLKSMGMKDAFSDAADFSGMSASANDRLRISAVVHKAFVDVNEEGTEAAAATGVTMRGMAMIANKAQIRADRPFLFFIRDGMSGTVLFMGQVADPKQ